MIFSASCAKNVSTTNVVYKILASSQATYDAGMKSAADLYEQGEISDEQKANIVKVATSYAQIHNAAVDALDRYVKSGEAADEERLIMQMSLVNKALIDLMTVIKPYLED